MSRVFVADEAALARTVVIKVLAPELAASINAERFRREIRVVAALQHPHVVPVLSTGLADGLLYYTMPFIRGASLQARLAREGELPVAEVLRLVAEIADALEYAHHEGIVHRDIKPANILLSDVHALITDFGVARALTDATGASPVTSVGLAIGTPTYMAPEQALADPHVDHRVDIYALGVVAYEMLAGRPPFIGGSVQAVLAAQVSETPRPVRELRPELPEALGDAVMRCLEKNPSDRWQTAGELLAHLASVSTAAPVTETGGAQGGRKAASRRSRSWGHPFRIANRRSLTLIGAGALLASPAVWWRLHRTPSDPPRVLVVAPRNSTGDSTLRLVGPMVAEWITQGLFQTGLVDAIDSRTMLSTPTEQASETSVRDFAARAGVKTLVVGSVYRDGDSLRFDMQLTDAATGRLRQSIEPVSAPVSHPTAALEPLRQRVTGALAVLFDNRLHNWAATASRPPTWLAYQEFLLGMRDFGGPDYETDIAHFERAVALDSSYWQARLWLGIAYANLRRYPVADSIFRSLDAERDLRPYDRATLDYFQLGFVNGDWEGAYRGARRMSELAPSAGHALYAVGTTARITNRFEESIVALRRIDLERGWGAAWALRVLNLIARSEHLLGRHTNELATARHLRRLDGAAGWARVPEIRALAALGRHADLDERLESAMALAATAKSWEPFSPGEMLIEAAHELRAHGDTSGTTLLLERGERWYRNLPAEERTQRTYRRTLARLLYAAGRWKDARELYAELYRADTTNMEFLAGLARAAAHQGDTTTALASMERIRTDVQPWRFGGARLLAGLVAASLGRSDEAITLVTLARSQGFAAQYLLHADPDFGRLSNLAAFRELVRARK